jgi:hypothetical protein
VVAQDPEIEKRSAMRAATQFRRAAMAADLRYMATATYRENVTDYGRSRHDIEIWLRRLRRSRPGVQYVGAPELQKRGAWHWHVLVSVRLDADEVRGWWRDIQDGAGTINLRYWDDPLKGALYGCKYVRKGFGKLRVPGVRYLRSRNIEVTCEEMEEGQAVEALDSAGWSGEIYPLDTGGWYANTWRR